jgi:hypothetical protein
MGVSKTDSTSIQIDSAKFNQQLKMDGYYIPYDEFVDNNVRESQEPKFAIRNTFGRTILGVLFF